MAEAHSIKRMAVFASGSGSNYEAIMNHFDDLGGQSGEIALVVCDQPHAYVAERAKTWNTPAFICSPKQFSSKKEYEEAVLKQLQQYKIDFIVLAGYMRLLGHTLLQPYVGKVINIHPSLLPSFTGLDAIGQALDFGVRVTGVTVHYVDEGMDTGPIIAQKPVRIDPDETRESITQKIQQVEHSLYPSVIQSCIEERVSLKGGKVIWQQQTNVH